MVNSSGKVPLIDMDDSSLKGDERSMSNRAFLPRDEPEAYDLDDGPQIEISEILRRVWAHRYILVASLVLALMGAWIYLKNTPSLYTATAVLLIEPAESNVIDLGNVVEGLDRSPQTLRTEVEVLQSRELAAKAVAQMAKNGTSNTLQATPTRSIFRHLNPLNYLPEDWFKDTRSYWRASKTAVLDLDQESQPKAPSSTATSSDTTSPLAESPGADSDEAQARRNRFDVDAFLGGLSVADEFGSRVIKVRYTSGNPKRAAEAANALCDAYVTNTLEVKFAGTRQAAEWLRKQVEEQRAKVEISEAEAEGLRQGDALVQVRDANLVSERIFAVNKELLEARTTVNRLKSHVRQIEQLRRSPNWEDNTSALLGSQLLDGLRLEQFRLEREAAELATEYGEKHPKMINIRAEIADTTERIRREIDRIVAASKNELQAASEHRSALQSELNGLTNQVGDLNQAEMRLREVEREASANRTLYENFLKRYNEASVQQEVLQADARVISYAEVPSTPSYPARSKIWIGASALGIGFGLGIIILLQLLDKGFRTAEQLQRTTGLPVLAQVPVAARGESMADQVSANLYSRFSESIGQLFVAAKLSADGDDPVKAVLITSALAKEGKTSTAAALARRAALFGEKTLLIDCDCRRPQAGKQLHMTSQKGIAEVLTGKIAIEEVLQQDTEKNLHFLAFGSEIKDAAVLLRSKAFGRLIKDMKQRYEFVVIDSSPVLAVVDPLLVARHVDKCFLIVRWGETPRKAVVSAIKQLSDFGVRVEAAVFTQVDTKKQGYYGYGEYGYYSNKLKGYYSD